jgi:hypothetical protein
MGTGYIRAMYRHGTYETSCSHHVPSFPQVWLDLVPMASAWTSLYCKYRESLPAFAPTLSSTFLSRSILPLAPNTNPLQLLRSQVTRVRYKNPFILTLMSPVPCPVDRYAAQPILFNWWTLGASVGDLYLPLSGRSRRTRSESVRWMN